MTGCSLWWDARIDPQDRGGRFRYDVYPVVGTPASVQVLDAKQQGGAATHPRLALAPDSSWAKKYFVAGSPEEKARIALAAAAPPD
ncbi:hypothetical protein DID96_35280 [Burkholderia sp. Bp8963]|uniref:hypothetical protein n=1 Tax=Burkholderia sp. Bp8963 TaxID=2184547 RepID=UPI000F5B5408|nr:hypothetical protein DID96_35280 [Burkholderia sp. Bp8963]